MSFSEISLAGKMNDLSLFQQGRQLRQDSLVDQMGTLAAANDKDYGQFRGAEHFFEGCFTRPGAEIAANGVTGYHHAFTCVEIFT
ncbi:MAG TPA: hypothetical protein DIW44_03225 [Anaerolineaceae bacterium]|nr:hypothetical protein [Anaerolineaceae bacterium]